MKPRSEAEESRGVAPGGGRTRFARIVCPAHGQQFLTEREYLAELGRPDNGWLCPFMDPDPENFGLCGAECDFDEVWLESKGEPAAEAYVEALFGPEQTATKETR